MTPVSSRQGLQGSESKPGSQGQVASGQGKTGVFLVLLQAAGGGASSGPSRSVLRDQAAEVHQGDGTAAYVPQKGTVPGQLARHLAEIEEVDLSRVAPAVLDLPDWEAYAAQADNLTVAIAVGAPPGVVGAVSEVAASAGQVPGAQARPMVMATLPEESLIGNAQLSLSDPGLVEEPQLPDQATGRTAQQNARQQPSIAVPASLLQEAGFLQAGGAQQVPLPQSAPQAAMEAASAQARAGGKSPDKLLGALFAAASGIASDSRPDVRVRQAGGQGRSQPGSAAALAGKVLSGSSVSRSNASQIASMAPHSTLEEQASQPGSERSFTSELQSLLSRDGSGQDGSLRSDGLRNLPEAQRQAAVQVGRQVSSAIVREGLGAGGTSRELRISLRPEHLGQVDVRIETRDDISRVLVRTETQQASDLLRAEIRTLEQALREAGFKLDGGIDVQAREQGRNGDQDREQAASRQDSDDSARRDRQQNDREPEEGEVHRILNPDAEVAVVI